MTDSEVFELAQQIVDMLENHYGTENTNVFGESIFEGYPCYIRNDIINIILSII